MTIEKLMRFYKEYVLLSNSFEKDCKVGGYLKSAILSNLLAIFWRENSNAVEITKEIFEKTLTFTI